MNLINYSQLHNTCNMGIKKFRDMGVYTQDTNHSGHTFIDNGSDILAVAHLDTVQNCRKFHKTSKRVYSARLDDRLGAYAILYLLPSLGVTYDILLTEDEEIGQSTAQYFTTDKQYNWMFQFDRGGTDVVMYQYDTPEYWELLEESNFEVGIGSFTDICFLDHLACTGFNFGTAYYKAHALDSYMIVDEFETNIAKFVAFYEKYKNTELPYDPEDDDPYYWLRDRHLYDRWNQWYYLPELKPEKCPWCDLPLQLEDEKAMEEYGMCDSCVHYLADYFNDPS